MRAFSRSRFAAVGLAFLAMWRLSAYTIGPVHGSALDDSASASPASQCRDGVSMQVSVIMQVSTLNVFPERIKRLEALARDLWWSWTPPARQVFRQLDYALWRSTAHNPVRMLQLLTPEVLERAMSDPDWLAAYDAAVTRLDALLTPRSTWCHREHPELTGKQIAYFSAEFALHQPLPIYAGGRGALAGDHCKEASDLGVPLIGVGFMYPQGYFHQSLTADGWQQEVYEKLNWVSAPIEPAITPDGKPCITAVPLGNRTVLVAVWRVRVGRVALYLLHTALEQDAPRDRRLFAPL